MYILTLKRDVLQLLNMNFLSAHVLSEADIQYINNISADTTAMITELNSELIAKVGLGAANKQTLNSLYVQHNNTSGLTVDDLTNFKNFVKHNLVGHNIVDVTALKINESVE